MGEVLLAATLAAGSGATAGSAAPWVIGRLREPAVEPFGTERPSLREVAATPRLAPALALVGAALGAVVGWRVGWTPVLAAVVYLTCVCLVLGYVDARTRLLPTQLIAPSYVVIGILVALAGLVQGDLGAVEEAALGWLVMGGFYVVMWLVAPRSLGYGDVRLSGLLALCLGYLGWSQLVTGLYAGFLIAGVASAFLLVSRRINRRASIPFGPYMMVGALAGVLFGPALSHWYTSR